MNVNAIDQLQDFIEQKKFLPDQDYFYPGLQERSIMQPINELINRIALDFIELQKEHAPVVAYQDKIKNGLTAIDTLRENLDSKDEDRVCHYIEQLMDIIELESSGGHLNIWRYGFDPTIRIN